MLANAREWRHILRNTDPKYVSLCIDIEHAHRAGMDPNALLREAGSRVSEIHLRNKKGDSPLQAFEAGDIDHEAIARTLARLKIKPLVVVELAYHDDTVITRTFHENVRVSRIYAERIFGL
jgi:sugar phosphate isomerase/epimerase